MAVVSVGSNDWADDAIDEPWLVERSLTELDWDQQSIAEFVAEYLALKESSIARPTIVRRIREMLGKRQIIEEAVSTARVRVPLYRFSAPRVKGASVKFSEGHGFFDGGFWKVKVFGVGAANSQTLEVATVNTFTAASGQCKLVYVPVSLRVARVRIEENGTTVGHGVRAQVIPPTGKDPSFVRGRGCMDLPQAACRGGTGESPEEDLHFEYGRDTGRTHHTVTKTWEMNVERDVSLRLQSADVEVGPIARVRRVRRMGLEISLPSGRDYKGYRALGSLWWVTP